MCTERHPEHLDWAPCVANAENHAMCQFFGPNGETAIWPNPNYVPVEHTTKSQRNQVLKGAETAVMENKREQRRSVGRSSVQHPTTEERMEGAKKAGKALEPEFEAAAMEAGQDLGRRLERITADELWAWLDDHEHYTDHPKAMTFILSKLIKGGVIEPVDKTDPDHERPSNRSNSSRRLAVYRSLIYKGASRPMALD